MARGRTKDLTDFVDRHSSPFRLLVFFLVIIVVLTTVLHSFLGAFAHRHLSAVHSESVKDILKSLFLVFAAYYAAFVNRKNKIVDVAIHCSQRYDAIAQEKFRADTPEEARAYYQRYWGLKSDELDFWMMGLVDPETIFGWFFQVMESFEQEKNRLSSQLQHDGVRKHLKYSVGWEEAKHTHLRLNPRMTLIVEQIRALVSNEEDEYKRLFKLIDILCDAERQERSYIRFSEVNFLFIPLRWYRMSSYKTMEKKRRNEIRSQIK